MTTPSVSVIVAVYNEEARIEECLYSLAAQDHPSCEVVVVDDGSTDATVALVERHPDVIFIRGDHRGAAAARNAGARAAGGDILIFVDGDMSFPPGWVSAMIRPFDDPEVYGTFTREILVANGHKRWARAHMLGRGLPAHTHFREGFPDTFEIYRAIRSERFWDVGGFDEIGHGEDVTLGRKLGRPAVVAEGTPCWHHEPEDLYDIFLSARWLGSGQRMAESPGAWKAHLPWRAVKTGYRMARRHRMPSLFVYR